MLVTKKIKSNLPKRAQVKKLVDEIISYVNSDLFQRNAARVIPAFSRSNLFIKPKNWEKFFNNGEGPDGYFNGKKLRSESGLLDTVIARSQAALLQMQDPVKGFWCAPLRADTTLESDTITLYAYMGWLEKKKDKIERMANYILSQQ